MPTRPPAPPESDHFSIGDVADATGITPETLRVWERRYGRPKALRLPSGHRRYTAEQIRWLRRVAEALARGHRPHKVVSLDEAALDALLAPATTGEAVPAGAAQVLSWFATSMPRSSRRDSSEEWDPDRHLAFLEEWIAPIVQMVGRSWADGELEIRHEHFASEVLQDVLRSARNDYPVPTEEPRVVLTTLSGETHGLGSPDGRPLLRRPRRAVPAAGRRHAQRGDRSRGLRARGGMVAISVSLATGGVETDRRSRSCASSCPPTCSSSSAAAGRAGYVAVPAA